MPNVVSLLLLLVGFTWLVRPMPTARSNISASRSHIKRFDAGSQLGGLNFPDPSIIQVDGMWYSFATRTTGSEIHIQIAQSDDFNTFDLVENDDGSQRDALPDLPSWVNSTSWNTWAPDVRQLDDGTFVMYYSATTAVSNAHHCVGAALSDTILGPYSAQEDTLFCLLSEGGAIDAAGYDDNGQHYVVYKVDGNSLGNGGACGNMIPPIRPTPIILQAVEEDGVTLQGIGTVILDNNGIEDEGTVEAPSLVEINGTYVLFFSSGCFTTSNYTVSYATASSITGPYTRAAQPLFESGNLGLYSPGGMSIYKDGEHMVFHARLGDGRALYNAVIGLNGSDEWP